MKLIEGSQFICGNWQCIWAPDEARATILGNNYYPEYGLIESGPVDARYGMTDSIMAAISADIDTAVGKLAMDTCFYAKNRDNPHLKALFCTCNNIELFAPIVFKTKYQARGHVLFGISTYAVLVTGNMKNRLISCQSQ